MQLNIFFRFLLICLLINSSALLRAQSTVNIVKRGRETGTFTGGVFIGTNAKYVSNTPAVLSGGTDSIVSVEWGNELGCTVVGDILTKTAANGWANAGATSYNQLDSLESGWLSYKITSISTVVAFGLSSKSSIGQLDSMDYAVLVDAGQLYVYNSGMLIGSFGSTAIKDSIRIERIGNALFYTKNQIVFYNQQVSPKQPLVIDAAMYTSGASLVLKTTATMRTINVHYRSRQNGAWNLLSTWESSYDSISWAAATITPDYHSRSIVIVAGDTVIITNSVTLDQTLVNGTLIYGDYAGNIIRIADGTGTGLSINGTFEDKGPNSIIWTDSSSCWAMGSTGTLVRTRATSSDNWRDHYKNGISGIPATSYWIIRKTGTDNPLLTTLGGMYYPNLTIENTSGSIWTTSGNSRFTGASGYPRIKGDFDIGGNGTNAVVFVNTHTDVIPVQVEGDLRVRTGSTLQNNGTGFSLAGDLDILGAYSGTKNIFVHGGNIQTIADTTFSNVRKLQVDKSGGHLKLNIPVTVDSILVLTRGYIQVGDTTVFKISDGVNLTRTSGYISTTGTGRITNPVSSLSPYVIPLGATNLNNTADPLIITLTPGVVNPQIFTTSLSLGNAGFVLSYDPLLYPTGAVTVNLNVATVSYTPVELKLEIGPIGLINSVTVFDQNTNNWAALSPNFYEVYNGNEFKVIDFHQIGIAYGYGISTSDRNWVYEVSFDANGVPVAEQKQYLDFIGRPTQMQVRNLADNCVVVSQTIYDNYGRAAIQTLPAPTGNVIAYQDDFITDSNGAEYSYLNFDVDNKLNAPDAVFAGNPGTLGAYYSDNGSEAYVATTSYPYARTEFSADPSSAGKRSAAAGNDFRMGSGHETRSWSMVSGNELKYIFGTNTSYKSNINSGDKMVNAPLTVTGGIKATKTISKDADGKEVVSYSAGGLPLASCYTGITGACSMTAVTNTMTYAGTRCVDIHLPAANKTSLKFPAPQYSFFGLQTIALSNITYKITDLNTNTVLISGTDYTLAGNVMGIPSVTFLGSYASGSSVLRISFLYSDVCLTSLATYNITPPDATVSYALDYSRWSVNYYDLAGRLRKSVSPKGINCSSAGTISMATTYDYSSMGQLIASKSPDEGLKEVTYDAEGKTRFTQNAVQHASNKFSYANYDEQGRATESGEYTASDTGSNHVFFKNYYGNYSAPFTGNTASSAIIDNTGSAGLDAGDCSDQNYVYYYPLVGGENIPGGYTYAGNYTARYLMGNVCKTKNALSETWYGYNQAGQTVFTVQQLKDADYTGYQSTLDKQIKTVDYTYNTANGTLTNQTYQKYNGTNETLKHNFVYDASLRLKKVYLAVQGGTEELLAGYSYYKTGALKRKELGDQLQGIDYIYTVNGQLKSINHPSLDENNDPGQDGKSGSSNAAFGKDVFGLTLDYHANDYLRTGSYILSAGNDAGNYYNGQICAQRYKTRAVTNSVYNGADYIDYGGDNPQQLITGTTEELITAYRYDEEYRLKTVTFGKFNNSTVSFTPDVNNCFKEWGASAAGGIGYDANGNITSLKRNAYNGSVGLTMDNFSYTYTAYTNKLASIVDAATSTYGTDFDAATSKTFLYNSNGQMTRDEAESINNTDILYNAKGLVSKVTFNNNNSAEYWYDDRGQKIKTRFYIASTFLAKFTWYVSDAGGNPLAMYEYEQAAGTPAFTLTKQPLYGAGRIGMLDKTTGIIEYEVTDHLGNVRATIKKISTGVCQLTSRTDYYAFGGAMPGRTYNLTSYQYNFQGQENAVGTNWQQFDLRMHNSDLGRWMAPDPYGQFASPYISMGNNPVSGVDPDGGYYVGGTSSSWHSNSAKSAYDAKQLFNEGWNEAVYNQNLRDANYLAAYQAWYKKHADNGFGGAEVQNELDAIKRQYGKNDNVDFGMAQLLNHNMLMSSDNAMGHYDREVLQNATGSTYDAQASNRILEIASVGGGYKARNGKTYSMNGDGEIGTWMGEYSALGDKNGNIIPGTSTLIGKHFKTLGSARPQGDKGYVPTNTILKGTQFWRQQTQQWTSGPGWTMPSNAIRNGGQLSNQSDEMHTNGISWQIRNPNFPAVANPGGRTTTTILQPVAISENDFESQGRNNTNPNIYYFRFTTGFDLKNNFVYQYGYLNGNLPNQTITINGWPQ